MSNQNDNNRRNQLHLLKLLCEVRAKECRASLFEFFKEFWEYVSSERLEINWHIEQICNELQDVGIRVAHRDESPYDLIINIPPGSSKSTMVSIMFPVWLWLHRPDIVIISSSYSSTLSTDHSLKSKSVFKSDRFQTYFQPLMRKEFGFPLTLVKDTEQDWRNNFGGGRFATSTGSSVTGKHADIIIRDDSLNPQQADSLADRESCNRFNDRTLSSRKKNKAVTPTITVMQRLHVNDPTGHDLTKPDKPIKHISLPAEMTETTRPKPSSLEKFYVDGLFDVNRFPRKVLMESKSDMGSYAYAGQYGQNPVPEGGGKIKGEWFEYCYEAELPPYLVWDLWIDGAYTKNTANDPTGLVVMGYDKLANRLYVKHSHDNWLEMPDLLKLIPDYAMQNNLAAKSHIYIEPKATGLTLIQLLAKMKNLNPTEIKSKLVGEGKEARVQTAAPKIEAGRVTLVKGAWNERFIGQLTTYPKGDHDEYCDIIGYAVDHYFSQHSTGIKRSN